MPVLADGERLDLPSAPRASTTESSVSSGEPLLEHAGDPAEALEGLRPPRRDRSPAAWPLPS